MCHLLQCSPVGGHETLIFVFDMSSSRNMRMKLHHGGCDPFQSAFGVSGSTVTGAVAFLHEVKLSFLLKNHQSYSAYLDSAAP